MGQIKIGKFIAERRKRLSLTQAQLAEKLSVTDRAVSKWETGKALPDPSIMLDLCEILKISVNDLLNGEVVLMENYNEKNGKLLIEMINEKKLSDKRLMSAEIIIGIISTMFLFGTVLIASLLQLQDWLRILLIVLGVAVSAIGLTYCIVIERLVGYYECAKCKHRYVPTFKSVFFAMHMGRTRYLKCPKCNGSSWHKKVLSKD